MKNKVLITGSEGFIGSHLVEKLVKKNFSVKAFVQYNSFNKIGWLKDLDKKILNHIEIYFGDIRDYESIRKAVTDCNSVINLAALIGIPYSYEATESYVDTNIKGLLNLMNACKIKQKKIIHTSTSEVYGTAQSTKINEKHPLVAQSPYAATKVAGDQLAISYFKSFDLPIGIVRPFNTFGPRQLLRAIIPTIISQTLDTNLKSINLGNLNTKRSFNYVDDITDGFYLALKNNSIIGEQINLGTSYNISIKDIVEEVSKISKIKKDIIVDKNRVRPKKSEVMRLSADSTKAKKLLKWKPKFYGKDGFRKGLKLTIDWFLKNKIYKNYTSKNYHI
jgi:NAD dependent epimerase/dehydratase|tara:strand:+ start:3437 stop:4438 length:1002 start_codon:yes stop_codon:yes gene_type:complete